MDDYTVRIVLDDTAITVAPLAKFVRMVAPGQYNANEALQIARDLICGDVWEPPYGIVAYGLEHLPNQPWSYTIIEPPNPYVARNAEYDHGVELARQGAEGDTVAAERFCKLFLAGVMNNYACGGIG